LHLFLHEEIFENPRDVRSGKPLGIQKGGFAMVFFQRAVEPRKDEAHPGMPQYLFVKPGEGEVIDGYHQSGFSLPEFFDDIRDFLVDFFGTPTAGIEKVASKVEVRNIALSESFRSGVVLGLTAQIALVIAGYEKDFGSEGRGYCRKKE